MSKKLTKAERQLIIQHVLAIAGRDLTSEEIMKATGTSESRLKGDLFGLRSDLSTNVVMVDTDGYYTHKYTGSIEFLDPLPEDIELDTSFLKSGKSKNEGAEKNEPEYLKPEIVKEEKVKVKIIPKSKEVKDENENISISGGSDKELRSLISKALMESKKKTTSDKIADNISRDNDLVQDELNLMVKDKLANSTYMAGFSESVFGSTPRTKMGIIEAAKEKAIVVVKEESTLPEKSEDKHKENVVSKITSKIRESILLILQDDGVNGGKGKNGLIKIIYDGIKGFGIPRHDIEDLISSLIESGNLAEYGKDGRGTKYISASYLDSLNSENEEDTLIEERAETVIESKKPDVSNKPITEKVKVDVADTDAVVGDFDINSLIVDLEESMKKDNVVLGPSISKLLSEVGLHIEKLEAENKKWRSLAKLFVNGIKNEFN
jgi:hypothetical protein